MEKMEKCEKKKPMRGSLRRDVEERWLHLKEDYRDPEYQHPTVQPFVAECVKCPNLLGDKTERTDSEVDIKSRTSLYDTIRNLGHYDEKPTARTWFNLRNRQRDLIFNLPPINKRINRRSQAKPCHYIPVELKEDGYLFSSFFLVKFMYLDDKRMAKTLPEEIERKALRDSPRILNFLANTLKQSEQYKMKRDYEKDCSFLFRVARHYEEKEPTWYWLADEFYELAVAISEGATNDRGYSCALINCLYGRFLLLKLNEPFRAFKCLKRTYELSSGRPWVATCVTSIANDNIYQESCFLLHIACLAIAEIVYPQKPIKALSYARTAVRYVKECVANQSDFETDSGYTDNIQQVPGAGRDADYAAALIDLSVYYTRRKDNTRALSTLSRLIQDGKEHGNRNSLLCAHLLMALIHLRLKNPKQAFWYLVTLERLAEKWKVPNMLAAANRYLGEHDICNWRYISGENHLIKAQILFSQEDMLEDSVFCSILYGIGKAFHHMREFCNLIIRAEQRNSPEYQKLVDFVCLGTPFWDENWTRKYIVRSIRPTEQIEEGSDDDESQRVASLISGERFVREGAEPLMLIGTPVDNLIKEMFENLNALDEPIKEKIKIARSERKPIYLDTKMEARNYIKYLKKQNNVIKKLNFVLGRRKCLDYEIVPVSVNEISEEELEIEMNSHQPIIPYKKDSLLYKQAVEEINKYEDVQSKTSTQEKDDRIYLPYISPKATLRLLNSVLDKKRIILYSEEPINIEDIIQEEKRIEEESEREKEERREFMEKHYFQFNKPPVKMNVCDTTHLL